MFSVTVFFWCQIVEWINQRQLGAAIKALQKNKTRNMHSCGLYQYEYLFLVVMALLRAEILADASSFNKGYLSFIMDCFFDVVVFCKRKIRVKFHPTSNHVAFTLDVRRWNSASLAFCFTINRKFSSAVMHMDHLT